MIDKTIQQHINKDRNELDNPNLSGQRRRHLQQELELLERYQEDHPGDDYDPTPLELFCNENPEAIECKIYEV